MLTTQQLLNTAIEQLETSNATDTPRLDAEILLAHSLNCERHDLQYIKAIEPTQQNNFMMLLKRRIANEPIAYITGIKDFWKSQFLVSPSVLIPRPDSETIIESVLKHYPNKAAALRILDLGTGSGCLLLSLLLEYPNAGGIGIDISTQALDIAKKNAINLKQTRAQFIESNWLTQLPPGQFDIIISNPPYITEIEYASLQPSVKNYEPDIALTNHENGLKSYEEIAKSLLPFIHSESKMFFEIGIKKALPVSQILLDNDYSILEINRDLGGIERVIVAIPAALSHN